MTVLGARLTVYGAENTQMPAAPLAPVPTVTPIEIISLVPTPTPMQPIAIMGTVVYQGACLNNIYVFMTDNNGGYYLTPPLTNHGLYSFVQSPLSVQGFVLWACYDSTGNGIQLTPNYSGYGYPVQQGNGASIENSGDVVCNVGYFGNCMALGPGGGTHYTSNHTVNIVFGGTAGQQSGSSCSN